MSYTSINKRRISYICRIGLHILLDDRRAFPWQHVPGLSIPAPMMHPGNRITVQKLASSQRFHPLPVSISYTGNRLVTMSVKHNITWTKTPTSPNNL
jgi:hypothetical protein